MASLMEAPPLNVEDIEKGQLKIVPSDTRISNASSVEEGEIRRRWSAKTMVKSFLASSFLENRGIQRVQPEERHQVGAFGYAQMILLWFSANLTMNNLAIGLLGPLVWSLSFLDCAFLSIFGALVGAAGTAYTSTFGPASGNRTMVLPTTDGRQSLVFLMWSTDCRSICHGMVA